MITDRDICIAVGTRNQIPSEIKVADVAPQRVYTGEPENDIHWALRTMQIQKVRRLPVVDRDRNLQGILCLDDIAVNANRSNGVSYDDVMKTLNAVCDHRIEYIQAA